METAMTDDDSSKPVMADEDITNISSITKSGDHRGEHDEEEEEEENEEEGMRSAYSVSDLLDELDSGSDDQVGVPGDDDDIAKQTAANQDTSCTGVAVIEEPGSHTDWNEHPEKPSGQDTTQGPSITKDHGINQDRPVILDRKINTIRRPPDTLDREVPMPDSMKTSDAELSPEHDYEPISNGSQGGTLMQQSTIPSSVADDAIYENVQICNQDDEDYWDSSDFESFEDTEAFNDEERSSQSSSTSSGVVLRNKDKPVLPPRNKKGRRSRSSLPTEMPSASAVFHKMAVRLGSRSKQEDADEDDDDSPMMEVILNMDKHPPPQLSEVPQHLTNLQITRRHIVSSIIESENSYLMSLRRIVQDYEKPLLEAKPQILSKSHIKTIFYKVKDILQCHTMFQIELSETIKVWDDEEKIGNVFNASFSKSIVFEVYSAFVNNFSIAMDTAKKQARSKQAFAEFLKYQIESSADKLSLFGLMVKPVQRFPQFILLLQDLLKKTPQDHHDRLPLQMALTELENLTLRLNEEKRKSESRHDVKRVMGMLSGRFTLKSDANRYLIRQDDVIQSLTINGETTCKTRRLFMLSDQVLCASVHRKQTESGLVERFRYKWSVPIQEVEVVQSSSKYKVSGRKATLSKFEPPDPPPADHPHKKDLDDLLHDLPMMEQIEQLVSRLRFKYPMLTVQSIHDNVRNLKLLIQHKTDIDQCVLRLSLPSRQLRTSTDRIRDEVSKHIKQAGGRIDMDKSRNSCLRTVYSFQMHSPSQKQDWLLELQLAKLALDPSNKPGWYLPEHNSHFTYKLPLYGSVVTIDAAKQESKFLRRSKKQTKVWLHCATPVLLPSDQLDLGIQHLWVCSGEKSHGQITVVALHTGQPHVIETFKSCGAVSVCAERVPGQSKEGEVFDDTVWIATVENKIHIYNVLEESREGPKCTIDTKDMVVTMCYHDNCLYAGHQKGDLAIYKQGPEGEWQYKTPSVLNLGTEPVASLLLVGSHVWAACGQHIHLIHQVAAADGKEVKYEQISHKLAQPEEGSIECMVKAGVGLIISFRNKGVIRLYHFETLEHLQDINVASVARTFFEGKTIGTDLKEGLKRLCVTCLLAIRGLLWIGTNIGCLLTLPLPRLEGVPQIRGRPSVSYHAHAGSVKFLAAIHCGLTTLHLQTVSNDHGTPIDSELDKIGESGNDFNLNNATEPIPTDRDEHTAKLNGVASEDLTLGSALRNRWISTPDLYLGQCEDRVENLETLYGSLMRGLDDDFEVEIELPKVKRMSKHVLSNLNAMSSRVTKFSGAMMNRLIQQDTVNKAATLPALHEDSLGNQCSSSSDNVSSGSHRRDSMTASGEFSEATNTSTDINYIHYENMDAIRQHEATQLQNNIHHYQNVKMMQNGRYVRLDADDQSQEPFKSKFMQVPHVHNKALVVLSGGEGHINWNSPKQQDVKSDDTCLITWQVPP